MRAARIASAAFGLACVLASPAAAQQNPVVRALTEPWPEIVEVEGIEILHVLDNVYMLVGGGANVTVAFGDEGLVMVDTGAAGNAERLQAAVRHLTDQPLRALIISSPDADKVGNNAAMVEWAGGIQSAVGGGTGANANQNSGTTFVAHESVFTRLLLGTDGLPPQTGNALPASTFFTARKDSYINGQPVQVFHAPNAHTDGDVIVFFRGSDVIHAGAIYRSDQFPVIDLERGGSINGLIDGLNHLLELMVPQRNQMGGTRVVPGHGRIGNEADVLEYRDMVTIIRDRVQSLIADGASLEQVLGAGVALEYQQYGTNPEWSTDMFVTAVYESLSQE